MSAEFSHYWESHIHLKRNEDFFSKTLFMVFFLNLYLPNFYKGCMLWVLSNTVSFLSETLLSMLPFGTSVESVSQWNASDNSSLGSATRGGIGPYKCPDCGRQYRWKHGLQRHRALECGDKEPRFQCPYCPFKCSRNDNLTSHVFRRHSGINVKATLARLNL